MPGRVARASGGVRTTRHRSKTAGASFRAMGLRRAAWLIASPVVPSRRRVSASAGVGAAVRRVSGSAAAVSSRAAEVAGSSGGTARSTQRPTVPRSTMTTGASPPGAAGPTAIRGPGAMTVRGPSGQSTGSTVTRARARARVRLRRAGEVRAPARRSTATGPRPAGHGRHRGEGRTGQGHAVRVRVGRRRAGFLRAVRSRKPSDDCPFRHRRRRARCRRWGLVTTNPRPMTWGFNRERGRATRRASSDAPRVSRTGHR